MSKYDVEIKFEDGYRRGDCMSAELMLGELAGFLIHRNQIEFKIKKIREAKKPFSEEKRLRKNECEHDWYEDVDDYNNRIRICKKCHEGGIIEGAKV